MFYHSVVQEDFLGSVAVILKFNNNILLHSKFNNNILHTVNILHNQSLKVMTILTIIFSCLIFASVSSLYVHSEFEHKASFCIMKK